MKDLFGARIRSWKRDVDGNKRIPLRELNRWNEASEVLKVTKEVPIERACDFSFAKKADSELTQSGWKP